MLDHLRPLRRWTPPSYSERCRSIPLLGYLYRWILPRFRLFLPDVVPQATLYALGLYTVLLKFPADSDVGRAMFVPLPVREHRLKDRPIPSQCKFEQPHAHQEAATLGPLCDTQHGCAQSAGTATMSVASCQSGFLAALTASPAYHLSSGGCFASVVHTHTDDDPARDLSRCVFLLDSRLWSDLPNFRYHPRTVSGNASETGRELR